MPTDATSQTALIVLAVAVSIQTVVMVIAAVGLLRARRQAQAELERRFQQLSARLDDTVQPIRRAADAVQEMSQRAADAIGRVDHAVTSARSLVTLPRNLLTVGVATLATAALRRWGRRTARATTRDAASSPAVH